MTNMVKIVQKNQKMTDVPENQKNVFVFFPESLFFFFYIFRSLLSLLSLFFCLFFAFFIFLFFLKKNVFDLGVKFEFVNPEKEPFWSKSRRHGGEVDWWVVLVLFRWVD